MKKIFVLYSFLLGFHLLHSQGINHDFGLFLGEEQLNDITCITNNTEFSELEIRDISGNIDQIASVTIEIELSNELSQTFKSFEAFNNSNLKFWLLSNNAFRDIHELRVIISGNNNNDSNFNETLLICLRYQEAIVVDRGRNKPDYVKMPVYFATDRNYVESENVYETFGVERSDMSYGVCEVSIPHNHKIGEIESPSIWRFEFTEDPDKHIVLHEINKFDKEFFFKKLKADIETTEKKQSFLFVHGYNVSFGDAAKRTAQISYDLLFEGKAVFYSWPSQASLIGYSKDESNIEWAQTNIKNFLEDYITKSGAEDIYLVAHSMGNRGLTRAVIDLMKERPELRSKIKEIILAAPDIDADVFKRDIAPKMVSHLQKPITLYVSSDDLALKASKQLHGESRAGDSGDQIVLVDGVETIDASGIDTSFLSHSYFADTSSIVSDIFDLIKTGKRALNRKRLQLVKLKDQVYYKVKKNLKEQ